MILQILPLLNFLVVFLMVFYVYEKMREKEESFLNRIRAGNKEPNIKRKTDFKGVLKNMIKWGGSFSFAKSLGKFVDSKLEEADVLLKGEEFISIVFFSFHFSFIFVFAITVNTMISILISILVSFLPFLLLESARQKRLQKINSSIIDALTIMSGALKSGFSFLQSMDFVQKELKGPLSREFFRALKEINFGASTEDALKNLSKRVKSEDLDLVVTAVLIQRQVGGNLAEVLDNISTVIRDRIRIKREVKTLTAQGRISGLIIGLLPVFLTIFILAVNPEYLKELFINPLGRILVVIALLGEITGFMIIRKIVDIKY
ncbi:type II secretion system F family protein [Thermovenabulum gondwanense]|nr:type II secretion system F family protein [Thermovenabulum gondwanense]